MKNIFIIIFILLVSSGANSQCFKSVSVGSKHTLIIKADGTLWVWGSNMNGQAGLQTIEDPIYTPRKIGFDNNWDRVFADGNVSFAIKTDGTLWAWGENSSGQLGNGVQGGFFYPIQIGTDTDWEFISSGVSTLARKTDGTLWGWGANIYGQLNLGETSLELNPVQISTTTNWKKVVSGGHHTLAIKTDGTLWACGLNDYGQLGDGSDTDRYNFVQIGTNNNWTDISGNYRHSVALKTDGTLWGWGKNDNNALGLGSLFQVNIPTQIGTDNDWAMVSTHSGITIAIKDNGTLWISDYTDSSIGLLQIGSDNDWTFIESGQAFFFAMKTDGTLWGWGWNNYGQLGIGMGIEFTTSSLIQLDCSFFVEVGIEQLNHLSDIIVYPNPTNDVLAIKNNSNTSILEIKLSDLSGKVLLKETVNFSNLNIQSLQSGIYILTITLEDKSYTQKIFKK